MNIRNRVLVSAGLAMVATLCCGTLLAIGAVRSVAADAEQERVQATSRSIAALVTLTNEYALHAVPRAAEQWQQQHDALTSTLAAPVQSGETSASRLALRNSALGLPPLFQRLIELNGQPVSPLTERRRELLVDHLLARTQALTDAAYRWSGEAASAEQVTRRWLRIGGAAALLLLLGTTLAQPVIVWRRVLRPLAVLETAAAAVERGDLTARCASTANDELGHVARRFDAMTIALGERSAELQRSERRLRAIADNVPALIAHIDGEQRYRFLNAHIGRLFGLDIEKTLGCTMQEIRGESTYAQLAPHIEAALRGEANAFSYTDQVQGQLHHYQSNYVPDVDAEGKVRGFFSMTFDITELKDTQRGLELLARVDTLTGLPNRLQFDERLSEAMARARRAHSCLALLFLDIDHFKTINDSGGHAAGDAVLKEFARRLKATVRVTDSVARLAGDEFVIILDTVQTAAEAEQVARKIVLAVHDAFVIDGTARKITTSIGVALFDSDATTPSELMAHADAALYQAKSAGRDGYSVAQT